MQMNIHADRSRSFVFTRDEQNILYHLVRTGRRSLLDAGLSMEGGTDTRFALQLMQALERTNS